MARPGSKKQIAIDIMNANADKSMTDVISMFAEAYGITISASRSYYVWLLKNTDTTRVIEEKTKTVRAPKKKVVKVKTKKEAVAKVKPEETKSPEEIERIKAANLARIKEVAKKFNKQEEVNTEKDPFAAPAFLTKEDVWAADIIRRAKGIGVK